MEVIRLTRLEPQIALDAINQLVQFRRPEATVDHGPAGLRRFGEPPVADPRDGRANHANSRPADQDGRAFPGGHAGQGGHVRTLPMSEEAARAALQQVEEVWPSHAAEQDSHHRPSDRQRFAPRPAAAEPSAQLPAPIDAHETFHATRTEEPPIFDRGRKIPRPAENRSETARKPTQRRPGQKVTTSARKSVGSSRCTVTMR